MIPKIFHRVWLSEPERPEFEGWREELRRLHPSWEIRTHQDPDALDWLRYPDLFRELLKTDPYGRAPDLLRYELLWKFGGVYIDTDFEPLRAFDELLKDRRPFAAWENDRTMCTAILAAPPKHPAIGVLLDGVEERLQATKGKPANEAIGPEYATAAWRERADVRRLPPWTFYPVGWWEKALLGEIDYPDRTFAVHHWAKGWDPNKPQPLHPVPPMSVLIAFRDIDGIRTPLWDVIRARFEQELPEAELVVASDDGQDPFHKTLALNRAAARATGEVFIITDADTWLPAEIIREAARFVGEVPTRWSKPWTHKLKLNQEATDHVLAQGADWDGTIEHRRFGRPESYNTFGHSPPLVLHRSAFETVGGLDERFRHGWGQEDVAFSLALTRFFGAPKKYPGHAIHLHHARIGVSGNDRWIGQQASMEHMRLVAEYRRARTTEAMRLLIEQRGNDDGRVKDDATRDTANAQR